MAAHCRAALAAFAVAGLVHDHNVSTLHQRYRALSGTVGGCAGWSRRARDRGGPARSQLVLTQQNSELQLLHLVMPLRTCPPWTNSVPRPTSQPSSLSAPEPARSLPNGSPPRPRAHLPARVQATHDGDHPPAFVSPPGAVVGTSPGGPHGSRRVDGALQVPVAALLGGRS